MVNEFTTPQKQLYNLIDANGAFVNPHAYNLNLIMSACDNAISEIPTELPTMLPLDQDALEEAINNLKDGCSTYITHSNRVSGVVRLNLGTIPDINQILGVSRARQQLKMQLGLSVQDALNSGLELFGSLYEADTSFTNIIQYVSTIIIRLQYNPSQLADVIAQLESYASFLSNLGSNDNSAYFTALHELYVSSMTYELTTFVDPPTTSETVVQERIGSEAALNIIDEQRDIVENK